MARTIRFNQAANEALREEMARDPNVIVYGEDVRFGIMGITQGLLEEFGSERVMDMPISEAGFTGMALGAAMAGLRPVVEYQIPSIPYVAMDQLADQLMKMRYMTGGQTSLPVTVRTTNTGASGGAAGQHSDHTYPLLMHTGFKIIMPSTPYDMKGLLKSAIREDDPVIVYEAARVLGTKGEVPEEEYTIPLGKGVVRRAGKDVTIVAVGPMVLESLKAAEILAQELSIECEVVDPRTLQPLDREIILESVAKTGRLVVADDSNRVCGFGSEVAAIVVEEAFDCLKAPIRRVTRSGFVVPFARNLEAAVLPNAAAVMSTVAVMVGARISV